MTIEVAAGILCNAQGQVLVSQRRAGTHLPGKWEFPGGKLEQDESPQQALERELAEELGIKVLAAQPLISVIHDYPEKTVRLHVFDVLRWQGDVEGCEEQALKWVGDAELNQLDMPAADVPILKALRLPGQYLITPQCPENNQSHFIEQLRHSLAAGIGIVQLRQPDWSTDALRALAEACLPVCLEAGARLVVNAGPEAVSPDSEYGLHLNSRQLRTLAALDEVARPVAKIRLLGASCHDEEELALARRLDCDYALLSPVKPTRSHPEAKPLGWKRFRDLAINSNLPVYALGGMQPLDQDQARAYGAVGVAGISGFWQNLL